MRSVPAILFTLIALLVGGVARAQTVHWEPAEGAPANAAVLVFQNCSPDGDPELPTIPGVTFTFIGRSESINMVNFQTSRVVMLSYVVRGRQNAPVQIPAFTVKTDKGPIAVRPYTTAQPAAQMQVDSLATAKLVPERTTVWAGEVFGLNYELSASRRTNPQISPSFDWNAAPLVAEDWSKPEVTEVTVNGERRLNVVFRTRVVAKTANQLKLEAASHLLSIQTGTYGFGIISQPRMEQVSVTSDQPTIEVRPLPTPPPGFSGAVGQFKLTSKIVPEKATVGEPITWTIELSGTGNWPDIAGLPAREVSNDFRVVQPKAKRTPAEGKLFDVSLSEDVVLVPTKPGTYALGPIAFTFFDPKTGTYVTRSAERTMVTIAPPAVSQFGLNPGPQAEDAGKMEKETPAPETTRKPVVSPGPPAGIPRDPLPGTTEVSAPLSPRALIVNLLLPVAALLGFWIWLAVRRAKQTDPVRPRREARDRLVRTLGHLVTANESDRAPLLLAWQRDTAVLWQLAHAAPRAEAFLTAGSASPSPGATRHDTHAPTDAVRHAWATLWAEADRALYGAKTALPPDWVARAQEALAAKTVPGFKPLRAFLPQNLMPFAALIACTLVATTVFVRAATLDGVAAYRKGEFAAAEKSWRGRIASAPTDWIARHNLSLALAQQERASEAAAQATAAFVQNPAEPAVRWHFGFIAEKAGVVPPALRSFVTPGPLQSLARLASPAKWELAMIAAAWAAAVAMGCLLFNAYGRREGMVAALALSATVLCAGVGAAAAAGAVSYGLAGKAEAVVVARATTLRSIPTEADTTQKTSPLAAGAIALADKTFLGWTRLAFENGQTGWVRKEEVVGLWR